MPPVRPSSPRSSTILVVVAISLAVGASASILAGAARSSTITPSPASDLYLTAAQLEIVAVASLIALVGVFAWVYFGSQRVPLPPRVAVASVVILLFGTVFLVLLRFAVPGVEGLLTNSTANNSSSNSTGSRPGGGGNASNPGGPLGFGTPHLPPWVLFVLVAVGALVAGAVVVPYLWRRASEAGGRRGEADPVNLGRLQGALASAAQHLESGDDPRSIVIELYAKLLGRVEPLVGGVSPETPEEIRIGHLVQLGIRSASATTLTRLFEEARYSSHPMGPEVAERARQAILEAREDLDRPRLGS